MEYGVELRRLRELRGISARQLALKVGMDPSYLARIERGGVASPRLATTELLAEALKLSRNERDVLVVLSGRSNTDQEAMRPRGPLEQLRADLGEEIESLRSQMRQLEARIEQLESRRGARAESQRDH